VVAIGLKRLRPLSAYGGDRKWDHAADLPIDISTQDDGADIFLLGGEQPVTPS
jgi:hypothetical protein